MTWVPPIEAQMHAEYQIAAQNRLVAPAEPSELSRSFIVSVASSLIAAGIVATIIVDQLRNGASQEGGQHA